MNETINLLDVVALTADLPEHNLMRGEIGTVVECHTNNAFEVEFVARDGYTHALVALSGDHLLPLRQKKSPDALAEPAAL